MIRIVWQTTMNGTQSFQTKLSKPLSEEEAQRFEQHLDSKKLKHIRVKRIPGNRALENASMNAVCPTPDGCKVECDGTCEHGWDAWMKILGVI